MNNNNKKNNINSDKINRFLKEIIKETRKIVNDEKMINKCDMCQGIIGRYFQKIGISFSPCSTNKVISDNVTGHSFIVALIEDSYYLIDPSFIQFKYDSSEEVIIKNTRCISKSPYYYLCKINETLANELISNGYFELTEQSAYEYGNAFYLTKTSIPIDFKFIPIKGDIFIKSFLLGNDKLTNYETGEIELDFKKNEFRK